MTSIVQGRKTGNLAYFFHCSGMSSSPCLSGIAPDVQHSLSLTSPSGQVKPVFHKHGLHVTKKKKKAVSALVMRQLMICRLCRTPCQLPPQHRKLAEFTVKQQQQQKKHCKATAGNFAPATPPGDGDRAPLGALMAWRRCLPAVLEQFSSHSSAPEFGAQFAYVASSLWEYLLLNT